MINLNQLLQVNEESSGGFKGGGGGRLLKCNDNITQAVYNCYTITMLSEKLSRTHLEAVVWVWRDLALNI